MNQLVGSRRIASRARRAKDTADHRVAFARIDDEAPRDEITSDRRHVGVGAVVLAALDLGKDGGVAVVVKGEDARKHGVEDHASRPDVGEGTVIGNVLQVRARQVTPGGGVERRRTCGSPR